MALNRHYRTRIESCAEWCGRSVRELINKIDRNFCRFVRTVIDFHSGQSDTKPLFLLFFVINCVKATRGRSMTTGTRWGWKKRRREKQRDVMYWNEDRWHKTRQQQIKLFVWRCCVDGDGTHCIGRMVFSTSPSFSFLRCFIVLRLYYDFTAFSSRFKRIKWWTPFFLIRAKRKKRFCRLLTHSVQPCRIEMSVCW